MEQVWWPLVSTVHGGIASLVVYVRSRSVKSSSGCVGSAKWWSLVAISNNKHKNHPKKHLVVMSVAVSMC